MSEDKSYLDSFTEKEKPGGFEQETFVAVKSKGKKMKIMAAAVAVVVLITGIFVVYNKMNKVQVPKLAGMTLEEANVWATQNKIVLASKSSYNFDIDSGTVISQETKEGAVIKKNSTLTIEISKGADPSEKITWPDIESMTKSEIETWISDNKLTGVSIETANSDVVAADQVISYSLTDDTEANFTRKSRATINISLGSASESETVVVEDFSTMTAGEALQWGTDNGVKVNISEAFDDYVSAGNVVSQSVKADTEIKKTVPVTVVISKGAPVIVPNFSSMSEDEANTWAKTNNVTLIVKEIYSSKNNKGTLLSQSISAGSSIEGSDELKLTYSLGQIDVESYIGKTKLDILNWQKEVNTKNGNISLSFITAYGSKGSSGKIISQSIKNDYVVPGAKISVVVSLGKKLLTPDFSGLTESGCNSLAQSSGVTIVFTYKTSSSVVKGTVIAQSPAKNTVITDAKAITITVALSGTADAVTVPDFTKMTKDAANIWAKTNKITLVYNENYRDDDAKGSLYDQSTASGKSVAQGSKITVYCSLGKSATVPSFIAMTKDEADAWAKSNNITLIYEEKNSSLYTKGTLYSQSVASGKIIAQGTYITVYYSLGKAATVPDFTAMSKDEADAWAKSNNVTLIYKENYRDDDAKGTLYAQSVSAGTSAADLSGITVYYSLGRVQISSFVGKTKLEMLTWLQDVNSKGANLSAAYTYADDETAEMNMILSQSVMNTSIDTGSTITFKITWDPDE